MIREFISDFSGRRTAGVLDDMIGGGGTLEAFICKLAEDTGIESIHVGVPHDMCGYVSLGRMAYLHEGLDLLEATVANRRPPTETFEARPYTYMKSFRTSWLVH